MLWLCMTYDLAVVVGIHLAIAIQVLQLQMTGPEPCSRARQHARAIYGAFIDVPALGSLVECKVVERIVAVTDIAIHQTHLVAYEYAIVVASRAGERAA